MVLNTSEQAIIAQRRELVARLRLRGYSQREIVETLASGETPLVNPATGGPWSLGTINSDIKALQGEWRREAKKAIDTHKARQLAELQEARRTAWQIKDLQNVLRSLGQEIALLGTEAPKITEISGKRGQPIVHKIEHSLDSNSATTIFDILAAVGAIPAATDDAKDDTLHPA